MTNLEHEKNLQKPTLPSSLRSCRKVNLKIGRT